MFGSMSLRLAAYYTAGFALAVALLGLVTILSTRAALTQQFDGRIRAELAGLEADYAHGGLADLLTEIAERGQAPGELAFGVATEGGQPLAGPLAGARAPVGWSVQQVSVNGKPETLQVLTRPLPGGYRLMAGDKAGRVTALSRRILWGFTLAFAAVLIIGAAGAFALSRAVQARMAAISGAAEAIIDGDLARRVPVAPGRGDDLDRLARTINRMLDRIQGLMESLRQVTSDVAHDLRTPLNRLHQRLERAAAQAHEPGRAEFEAALGEVDAILATFAALLRIAEVEAGARRAAFPAGDLAALARAVAEDFAPAAEDTGHRLLFEDGRPAQVEGDAELLTQMIVNLVENALRHTPAGATVRLAVAADGEVTLRVADDGPGVPEAERARLFDRFYRLERSRSKPGSGLGLALVQAVARLHRAEAALHDARPGLEVRIVFPPPTS